MNAHRITITPTLDMEGRHKRSSKGLLFNANFEGQAIVVASTEPCLDGARALEVRGMAGRLEMWDAVVPYFRFRADIDKAAGLTVREGDELPRLVKFDFFAPCHAQDGDFASGVIRVAQTGESHPTDCPQRFRGHLQGRGA